MSLGSQLKDPGALIDRRGPLAGEIALGAVAGLVVFALAWGSHVLTGEFGRPPTLWPANAAILAGLIRTRLRQWPAIIIGGTLGNLAENLMVVSDMGLSLGIQFCNIGEVLVCAAGLRKLVGSRFDLNRLRHIVAFAFLALLSSGLASLSAGQVAAAFGRPGTWHLALLWTLSDALGLMILTPPMLTLDRAALSQFVAPKTVVRNLGLMALLIAVTTLAFLRPEIHLRVLVLATVVLVAFEAGPSGAAIGLLIVSLTVSLIADSGFASHRGDSNSESQLLLQAFLLAGVCTAFPVAASVARRKLLEHSLAARAHDFQMLVDHSTDLIIRFGRDLSLLYASPSCAQLGYRQEDLVGHSGLEFVHPDDIEQIEARSIELLDGMAINEAVECRIQTASGDWIWVEGRSQTVEGDDGQIIEVVTMLRNVTERKTSQAALAKSEARYRMLAETARDIIMHFDTQGVVQYVSPSGRQLGYEPQALVNRQIWDLIHPADLEATRRRMERMMRGETLTKGDLNPQRVRRASGGWVWLEGNPTVLRDETGSVTGFVSSLRDISIRKALEEKLQRKQAEAEAATIAKTEFLANMSHEIRTPLTAILGFSGVLEKIESLPQEAQFCANRIATAGQSLLTVVNDILDFSKIEAGQLELDPHPFDPTRFIEETVYLVEAQAAAKRLSVVARMVGEIPSAVSADAARLRQVLLNLLTNAIKFTARGEVVVEARFEGTQGGALHIAVSDTGAGIAAAHMDRLFQRFSQADGSVSRRYGGTGLGLAICKNLTALMGGSISVESVEGQGSTFRFSIKAPSTELPARSRPSAPDRGAGSPPAKILVVDDVTANREVVRALLGALGHELIDAASGAEAVERASEEAFDLILMDLQMPGMDGLTATRAIRAQSRLNRATPIVALSADVLDLHRDNCREAGMDDHIAKPIDPRELVTKVTHWSTAVAVEGAASALQTRLVNRPKNQR